MRLHWRRRFRRKEGAGRPGSYVNRTGAVQSFARFAAVTIACAVIALGGAAGADRPVRVVALGDSLVAGYGLAANETLPAKLQRAVNAKGVRAEIANAGVSGDTASDALARLDWSVPEGTEAVIVEVGGNDFLRGRDPAVTRRALEAILKRLAERKIAVLLCGMLAPPNMGADYKGRFDAIYPELAAAYGTLFDPFILEGVAGELTLNQRDGLHPSAAGIDVIVGRLLPKVEALIERAKAARGS